MPEIGDIREEVGKIGLGEATIQQFGSDKAVSIRTALPEGDQAAAERAGQQLVAGIQKAFPTAHTGQVETVSGKVSEELLRTGAISLALAMLGISIYIWVRFEWQFGVGALGRLFHEVALTFGFFAVTQIQFDLNSVAALLTIVRSEEHTSELQSLMRISYAVFCLTKKLTPMKIMLNAPPL